MVLKLAILIQLAAVGFAFFGWFEKKVYRYSYQQFVLTWPGTFCSEQTCLSNWMTKWDGRSFTVHGLWPTSRESGFLQMISSSDEDPTCTADRKFEWSWLTAELQDNLNRVMPSFTRKNLQEHEWNKHGVCYLKLLSDRVNGVQTKPTKEFSRQVFVKYFETIVSLYDRIAGMFRLGKSDYLNGDELAKALGLDPASVQFSVKGGSLREIRICLGLPESLKTAEQPRRCELNVKYRGSIHLPGFRNAAEPSKEKKWWQLGFGL